MSVEPISENNMELVQSKPRPAQRALAMIAETNWVMAPESLQNMMDVAARVNDAPEAVVARLGRPLQNTRNVTVSGDAALIPVHGMIFPRANMFTEISGGVSLDSLRSDIATAEEDQAVARLIFGFDTPGGDATGVSEAAQIIGAVSKPTIGYVSGMAASGGYWLASATDQIIISDTALLGSIGVVSRVNTKSRDGEIEIVSTQSPNKRPDVTTDAGRAEIQRVVDDLASVFVESVAANRNVSAEHVQENFGKGGLLVGRKAVEAGMADAIGTLDSILAGNSGANEGGLKMADEQNGLQAEDITLDWLAENRPHVLAQIEDRFTAATAEARVAAAAAERERIMSIFEQSMPGHEDLIRTLAFDGSTTGPEAAVAILKAEREQRKTRSDGLSQDGAFHVPAAQHDGAAGDDGDFEAKVAAFEHDGLSHGKAMSAAVKQYPELHRRWLARINSAKSA